MIHRAVMHGLFPVQSCCAIAHVDGLREQVSGHPAVAPHMVKFYGIRNGIDQDIWDPLDDRFLPM